MRIEHLRLTPEALAIVAAIDTGLVHEKSIKDGQEFYNGTIFMSFFERFGWDLAEEYGFESPDDVWKEIAKHRTKNRKSNFKKHA